MGFAILLIGSSVAVGVWVSADSQAPNFAGSVSERYDSLDGFSAEKRTVIHRENRTFRSLDHVSRRPGTGQFRIEDITDNLTAREIQVSDGNTLWIYTHGESEAKRIDGVNTSRSLPSRLDRLFSVVERGASADGTTHDIEPLPFVPEGSDRTDGTAGSMAVSYEGVETVDGRPTYVLSLHSNATTAGVVEDFEQRLWIDKEWYVPLKRTTEYVRDGDAVSITVSYRNVTFNPGLPADTFQFDPPSNVTVVDADSTRQEQFVDIAGLRAVASFSVPDPDVPETFRLVEATQTVTDRVRSIGLKYANETAVLSVSKSNLTGYVPNTDGQAVPVGDYDATLRNLGTELRVSWTTPNARYSVAGSGVSKSVLVEFARSVARADS
ncbi:outer membrane lipoprotein carrier protein LolA [Halorhabdus sp. BNX81]|uniref:LolA family protein n=1 Tax=Halorhabdus sp. BNX81 TaxID=2980181 RepID=UPI0023DD4B7B|nr:outer membrane lipoprotein carrier protein LolA [Halorhabdus sp. BNX81]WEL21233.1 Outer membrane lipoprotein-sorting protein [Halorhabdus sp. BNX81]